MGWDDGFPCHRADCATLFDEDTKRHGRPNRGLKVAKELSLARSNRSER